MIGMLYTWRVRYPQILTNLCSNLQFRYFITGKDQIGRNGHIVFVHVFFFFGIIFYIIRILLVFHIILFIHTVKAKFDDLSSGKDSCKFLCVKFQFRCFFLDSNASIYLFPGSKISCFIKLVIVWQIDLWYKSKDFSMAETCSHVVEFALIFQWQTYKNQCIYLFGLFCNTKKLCSGFFQKSFLPEQVSTGISCNTKFREYHNLCTLFLHFVNHFDNLVCIKFAVCHLNIRSSCSHFNKSVFHRFLLASYSLPL